VPKSCNRKQLSKTKIQNTAGCCTTWLNDCREAGSSMPSLMSDRSGEHGQLTAGP